MKPLEHSSLQCIYCDDIRDEAGGKTTIVGWYGGNSVNLPAEGPLLIPTLGIVGMLVMPPEQKCKSMRVDFLQDENVLQSVVMPDQALNEMHEKEVTTFAPILGRQTRIVIKINHMQVVEPCTLRMRITVDDEEVYSNGLRFAR